METVFCLCLVMETVGLVAVWDTAAVELWYSAEKKALKQTSLNSSLCLYRNIFLLYFTDKVDPKTCLPPRDDD